MDDPIAELKKATEDLQRLFDDPHPGLISWHAVLQRRWKRIVDLYGEQKPQVVSAGPWTRLKTPAEIERDAIIPESRRKTCASCGVVCVTVEHEIKHGVGCKSNHVGGDAYHIHCGR